MWLRIAAKCTAATRVERAEDVSCDPFPWLRERVNALCEAGACGPLFVFIREPPDARLCAALRWVADDRRLVPALVAQGRALTSRAHLEQLQHAGALTLYLTLYGSTATTHDTRAGEPGSWRRVLLLLTQAPQIIPRVRVGVHVTLSSETADDLTGILRLSRKVDSHALLLWDAGCGNIDGTVLEPAAALSALDVAMSTAQKLGVRIHPVGFERTRAAVAPMATNPCVATGATVELLRDGIPLPSARTGLLASKGTSAPITGAAPTGAALTQLACEFAANGRPLLDLPACLGGPPPSNGPAHRDGIKVGACSQCPIDPRCFGVPPPVMEIPGMRQEIRPPAHWMPMSAHARVLVLCPVVSDALYGATFFGLARALARLGARVDVVSPWAMHADITPAFAEDQPIGRPPGRSEVEKFVSDGPVDGYDLVVTPSPDPHAARALVEGGRLRPATRLAATDFHMLQGMNEWARDLCGPRRPEEGGWWPSDQLVLYSAFPGYAPLYTRYGVPMRQVVWQPYALDPASFSAELRATEGTSIISAGRHRRDLDTLLAAAARLGPAVHPIDLFAPGDVPHVPRQVRFGGTVDTSVFCRAVGRSRFMVVPLREDPHNASGITAMATAIMCGRPIVATATPAARDYVCDGVNGLLVPAAHPRAMAEAIERLDTDSALLSALAAGARAAAEHLTTDAWARALLGGSGMSDLNHWMWTKWRAGQRGRQ